MRWFRLLRLCCCLATQRIVAQSSASEVPWQTSHFPYLTYSPNEGLYGMARIIHFKMGEFGDRVSLRQSIAAEAGYSTHRSWAIRVRADLPRIADGWRIEGDAEIASTPRFGDPENFQDRRSRGVNVEVTRRIRGALHLAGRVGTGHLEHRLPFQQSYTWYPSTPATSPCNYIMDPSGDDDLDDCSPTLSENDTRARLALVLDLRNREFETTSGGLFEGGIFSGTAGDGYRGAYGIARGWLTGGPRLRFTSRVAFRALSRSAAFGIQHEIPAWEHPLLTLGGPSSQRGLGLGEESGRGVLLGGIEGRYDLKSWGDLGAISVLSFVDGGRTFRDLSPLVDPVPGQPVPNGNLQFTLKTWKWSVGGGLGIRLLKAAQLNVTFAVHDSKTAWYISTGWSW